MQEQKNGHFFESPTLISQHDILVLLSLLTAGAHVYTFKVPGTDWTSYTSVLFLCIPMKRTDHLFTMCIIWDNAGLLNCQAFPRRGQIWSSCIYIDCNIQQIFIVPIYENVLFTKKSMTVSLSWWRQNLQSSLSWHLSAYIAYRWNDPIS